MTRAYALAVFAVTGPALAFIAAVALWLNGIGPSPADLIVFAVGTVATTAGVELGFHRYFAHRAFSAAPALIWVLGALGSSAFLGPVLWLAPLMLPVELISHFARPLSLSLRLLGNIFADHKVVASFFMLVPLLVPVPFMILGLLVAVVQTFIFCLLTMIYIQGAVAHEHDEEEKHS